MDEISKAVNQLRRDKTPGVCNITIKHLRDTGESTKVWLHGVISTVWEQDREHTTGLEKGHNNHYP